jgi:hypothetical protein
MALGLKGARGEGSHAVDALERLTRTATIPAGRPAGITALANRPLLPEPINDNPLMLARCPHGLGQLAGETGSRPIGTTQGRPAHDQWAKLR